MESWEFNVEGNLLYGWLYSWNCVAKISVSYFRRPNFQMFWKIRGI